MALKRATDTRPLVQTLTYQCVGGRGGCDAALAVRPRETASSADLGGRSIYTNENFED